MKTWQWLEQQADAARSGSTKAVNPELRGAQVQTEGPGGSLWWNPSGDRGPAGDANFGDWDGQALRSFQAGDAHRGDAADVDPLKQGDTRAPVIPDQLTPQQIEQQQAAQAKQDPERPAQAAPDEGGTGDAAQPGRDGQSPGDGVEEAVDGILRRFKTPRDLAVGYKEIQRLATAKGEELKRLQEATADQLRLVREHFEQADDGKFVLRPEAAVARLQEVNPPSMEPDATAIRGKVIDSYRHYFQEELKLNPEEIDDAMQRSAGRINTEIQREVQATHEQWKAHEYQQRRRAWDATAKIFTDDPDLEDVREDVERHLRRFPSNVRHRIVNNGWMDIGGIARLHKLERNFETAVREAYAAGLKAQNGQEPDTHSPTPTGARAPKAGARTMTEDQAIKAGILGAGDNPYMDNLRQQRGGLKSLFD